MGVSLKTLSGDTVEASHAGVGYLAKILAIFHGGDMDLYCRKGHGFEGIEDSDAGMRIGGRIDDDAVESAVCLLDLIDDVAFMI